MIIIKREEEEENKNEPVKSQTPLEIESRVPSQTNVKVAYFFLITPSPRKSKLR